MIAAGHNSPITPAPHRDTLKRPRPNPTRPVRRDTLKRPRPSPTRPVRQAKGGIRQQGRASLRISSVHVLARRVAPEYMPMVAQYTCRLLLDTRLDAEVWTRDWTRRTRTRVRIRESFADPQSHVSHANISGIRYTTCRYVSRVRVRATLCIPKDIRLYVFEYINLRRDWLWTSGPGPPFVFAAAAYPHRVHSLIWDGAQHQSRIRRWSSTYKITNSDIITC